MSRRYWYFYISGAENDASSYIIGPSEWVDACTPGTTICAVYGLPGTIDPSLPRSSELNGTFLSYSAQAKIIKGPYPVSPQKPYVYVRY